MQVYNNSILIQNTHKAVNGNVGIEAKNEPDSFSKILNDKIAVSSLQFSKHASMRLNNRSISLSNEQLKRVEDGVNKATQKGINDSLVIVDNIALVVNIKNRIVITAMDKNFNNDNIFTNIDGAVIV